MRQRSNVSSSVNRLRPFRRLITSSTSLWAWCVNSVLTSLMTGLPGLKLPRFWSCKPLLARLEQQLALLIGGPHDLPARQRTLRAEIAWSYDLLSMSEQRLFRRLGVFVDGFALPPAQAVGDAFGDLGIDVIDGVISLVDKNLLRQVDELQGEPRFGMLEMIREFELEQLAVHHQHVRFFLAVAEAADSQLRSVDQLVWLQRLEADDANLQTVLAWSLRA